MKKSLIFRFLLCLIAGPFICISQASAASTVQVVCNKGGNLIVRPVRCKRGETRVNVSQLVNQAASLVPQGVQGPVGPQGETGPTGPKGDPAGFDVATCYSKTTNNTIPGIAPNASGVIGVDCNNPNTEFMLTSSFGASPIGSSNNKPFIQGKSFTLDATGKYPIGVDYYYLQSVSNNNGYGVFAQATCCIR